MVDDKDNPFFVEARLTEAQVPDVGIVLRPVVAWIGWFHCALLTFVASLFLVVAILLMKNEVLEAFMFLVLSLPLFTGAAVMARHMREPSHDIERRHSAIVLLCVVVPLCTVSPILIIELIQEGRLTGPFGDPIWFAIAVILVVSATVRWCARDSHRRIGTGRGDDQPLGSSLR